jgi:hypothetical protein
MNSVEYGLPGRRGKTAFTVIFGRELEVAKLRVSLFEPMFCRSHELMVAREKNSFIVSEVA